MSRTLRSTENLLRDIAGAEHVAESRASVAADITPEEAAAAHQRSRDHRSTVIDRIATKVPTSDGAALLANHNTYAPKPIPSDPSTWLDQGLDASEQRRAAQDAIKTARNRIGPAFDALTKNVEWNMAAIPLETIKLIQDAKDVVADLVAAHDLLGGRVLKAELQASVLLEAMKNIEERLGRLVGLPLGSLEMESLVFARAAIGAAKGGA